VSAAQGPIWNFMGLKICAFARNVAAKIRA